MAPSYQEINEPIMAAGVYHHGKFHLKRFQWRNKIYNVAKITLTSDVTDGTIKYRWISVLTTDHGVYRLRFNREDETWLLSEVWVE